MYAGFNAVNGDVWVGEPAPLATVTVLGSASSLDEADMILDNAHFHVSGWMSEDGIEALGCLAS